MNDKKMKQPEGTLFDDEFDLMLQEFIDHALDDDDLLDETNDTDDSPVEPAEDTPIQPCRTSVDRAWEQPQFAVFVCVLENLDKTCYTDGPITVHIVTADDLLPDTNRFKCYVYTEDNYPICSTDQQCSVRRSGGELTYEMACSRIWLPGNYVLYVRDNDDLLTRMDFTLDGHLETHFDAAEPTLRCDANDVLTALIDKEPEWKGIASLPGMRQMRERIIDCKHLSIYNSLREEQGGKPIHDTANYLICTRRDSLREWQLAAFHSLLGRSASFHYVDCSTLYDATCNNPYEHLNELLLSIAGDDVCLTRLGALLSTGGKTIVRRLLGEMMSVRIPGSLWLCGTRQEIEALLDQFPSMKEMFGRDSWIEQEPYTEFELVQAFFDKMQKENLEPSAELKDCIVRTIRRGYRQGTLSNWALTDIHRIVEEEIRPRYMKRALAEFNFGQLPLVSVEDVDLGIFAGTADTYEQCMDELNAMVGLGEVKQGITTMANNTRFFLERRRRGLPTSGDVAYHAIFTGNPGTGKTTVARQLGKIYHALGLLSKGEVITADRTKLVGRYIGETEENMKAVLEEARGNVLFIDEAYNLYDGSGDRKDFGARVIDSLLTVLSQPDPDMLVVFAGYEKEMDAMLNTNPGLMGRFPYKYRFKDYDAEQLMEIACRLFQRDAYILSDEARDLLSRTIVQTLSQPTPNFGNARWIEQYVRNGIIPAMADRLAATASDDYQHIEADDIRKAYERFNPKAVELKPRRKVGFSA